MSLVSNFFQFIKMDHPLMVIVAVLVAALCIHQLLAAYIIIFEDVPTASDARAAKRHKHDLIPYKRNLHRIGQHPT